VPNGCQSLFFKSPGQLWEHGHYLDIGRIAMRSLIDRNNSEIDRFRCHLLDQHWTEAVKIGANDNLASLMGSGPSSGSILLKGCELRGAPCYFANVTPSPVVYKKSLVLRPVAG